jgi:hypothetical protein
MCFHSECTTRNVRECYELDTNGISRILDKISDFIDEFNNKYLKINNEEELNQISINNNENSELFDECSLIIDGVDIRIESVTKDTKMLFI